MSPSAVSTISTLYGSAAARGIAVALPRGYEPHAAIPDLPRSRADLGLDRCEVFLADRPGTRSRSSSRSRPAARSRPSRPGGAAAPPPRAGGRQSGAGRRARPGRPDRASEDLERGAVRQRQAESCGSPFPRASTACSASFGPIARAASSALDPSGSSSTLPSGSVTFTSREDSRVVLRVRGLGALALQRSVVPLESVHDPTQELVELAPLRPRRARRQRSTPSPTKHHRPSQSSFLLFVSSTITPAPVLGVVEPTDQPAVAPCFRAVRSSRRSRARCASRASPACRGTAPRSGDASSPCTHRGSGRTCRASLLGLVVSRRRWSIQIRSTIPSVSRSSSESSRAQTSRHRSTWSKLDLSLRHGRILHPGDS